MAEGAPTYRLDSSLGTAPRRGGVTVARRVAVASPNRTSLYGMSPEQGGQEQVSQSGATTATSNTTNNFVGTTQSQDGVVSPPQTATASPQSQQSQQQSPFQQTSSVQKSPQAPAKHQPPGGRGALQKGKGVFQRPTSGGASIGLGPGAPSSLLTGSGGRGGNVAARPLPRVGSAPLVITKGMATNKPLQQAPQPPLGPISAAPVIPLTSPPDCGTPEIPLSPPPEIPTSEPPSIPSTVPPPMPPVGPPVDMPLTLPGVLPPEPPMIPTSPPPGPPSIPAELPPAIPDSLPPAVPDSLPPAAPDSLPPAVPDSLPPSIPTTGPPSIPGTSSYDPHSVPPLLPLTEPPPCDAPPLPPTTPVGLHYDPPPSVPGSLPSSPSYIRSTRYELSSTSPDLHSPSSTVQVSVRALQDSKLKRRSATIFTTSGPSNDAPLTQLAYTPTLSPITAETPPVIATDVLPIPAALPAVYTPPIPTNTPPLPTDSPSIPGPITASSLSLSHLKTNELNTSRPKKIAFVPTAVSGLRSGSVTGSAPSLEAKITVPKPYNPARAPPLQISEESLFFTAAAWEGNLPKVKEAISKNYPINGANNYGQTPLHCACRQGHFEIAKELLLQPDVNINAQTSNNGSTPLHRYFGHAAITALLLAVGADYTLTNTLGLTPQQEMKADALVAWRIFREHGVDGLQGNWEEIAQITKRDYFERKLERTDRVVSQRPRLEDIPRPIRPRDLKGKEFTSESNDELKKGNLTPGPKLDQQRTQIVQEMVDTERNYVAALRNIVNDFKPGFIKVFDDNNKTSEKDRDLLSTIFANTDKILALNEAFLSELERKFSSWSNTTTLGETYMQHMPLFTTPYGLYNDNYAAVPAAVETLFNLSWLTPPTTKYALSSALITPVQRLPRYRILVQDLLSKTPDNHPDEKNLQQAWITIGKSIMVINDNIKRSQTYDLLHQLGIPQLMSHSRSLINQAPVHVAEIHVLDTAPDTPVRVIKVNGNFHFVLFNDVLVFWKTQKKETKKRDKELVVVGKFTSSAADTREKENEARNKDMNRVTVWPLELVWIIDEREKATGTVAVIGPKTTVFIEGLPNVLKRQILATVGELLKSQGGKAQTAYDRVREGKYTFSTKEVYDGWWEMGKFHGYGCYEFCNTFYEGEFENNVKNGTGILEYADGQLFEGTFRHGYPEGFGRSVTLNGDKYNGNWLRGRRNGFGKLSLKSGEIYNGEWKNGIPHGEGELILESPKRSYKGSFVLGRLHGKGILTTSEWTYFGNFDSGIRTGDGELTYLDGNTRYVGLWKEDEWEDQGSLTTPEFSYTGTFHRGKFHGKGSIDFKSGASYDGAWKNGMKHGKGTYKGNGYISKYFGEWFNDVRHGQGELTLPNGDIFIGHFVMGIPEGPAKIVLQESGTILEGKIKNGNFVGKVSVTNDVQISLPDLSVGEDSISSLGSIVVQYLIPPMLPLFQFQ